MNDILDELLNSTVAPLATSKEKQQFVDVPTTPKHNIVPVAPVLAPAIVDRPRPARPRGAPRRSRSMEAEVGSVVQRVPSIQRPIRLPHWVTYERSTIFTGVLALDLVFIGLWWVNGHYTAQAAYGIGVQKGWAWLQIVVGGIPLTAWGVHLLISVIEQHTWKARAVAMATPNLPAFGSLLPILVFCAYLFSVAVGTVDVLTTAVGLGTYFGIETYVLSWPQVAIIAFSELCAIVPEPMIVALTTMLVFIALRKTKVEATR